MQAAIIVVAGSAVPQITKSEAKSLCKLVGQNSECESKLTGKVATRERWKLGALDYSGCCGTSDRQPSLGEVLAGQQDISQDSHAHCKRNAKFLLLVHLQAPNNFPG